jgi:indolepyruvate ferredoxin oxidoreductase alpha subunit
MSINSTAEGGYMKELLTGNEAIAQAAYDAGVQFASAYPGTQAQRYWKIFLLIKISMPNGHRMKVAMEGAIGASYAERGNRIHETRRAECCGRPVFYQCLYGSHAGLVVVTRMNPGCTRLRMSRTTDVMLIMQTFPCLNVRFSGSL